MDKNLVQGNVMNFVYEDELIQYMKKTGKKHVLVELVTSDTSDIEIAELYVHLVDAGRAEEFKKKKRYRTKETEHGEVLLPPMKLQIEDTVTLGLKSFWFIRYMTYKGIRI